MSKRVYNDPNDPLYDPATAPRDEADAVVKDRVRVMAILDSEHGKRAPTLARKLALEHGMDAEGALDILAHATTENPAAAAGNPYLAALEKEASVTLGAPAPAIGGDPKAARKAELRQAGREYSIRKGYTRERA